MKQKLNKLTAEFKPISKNILETIPYYIQFSIIEKFSIKHL